MVLPATLQKITKYNFLNAMASEFIIGENVTTIESASINNGSGKLKKITFNGKTPPTVATDAFGSLNTALQEIYVPKGTKQSYYNALKDVQIDSSRKITESMIIEQ